MKAVLEGKEKNTVKFSFEISSKEFNKAINGAYLKNKKYFNIPGFRKGKAPRQIIEMAYGKEIFYEDAINDILPSLYEEAIEELELLPVDQPEIDIDDIKSGEPIKVTVEVDVEPEVELGDYSNIEIEAVDREVTEEMVEEKLKSVQEMNGRLVDASDRPVEEGDTVTIDYSGSVDGEKFEGGTAEEQQLEIGSGMFIPGFEEQLVGKKVDEEVEVNVTFPEEYQVEDLAGKEAVFQVLIHDIKAKELPKLDDEFAKDVSEFDTLEEYKEELKKSLVEEKEAQADMEEESAIIDAIIESSEVDIPEGMINRQVENEVSEFGHNLSQQGLTLEQYFQLTGTTEENLQDQLRPVAKSRVKGDLVLSAIAEKEGIEVTEEDRVEELNRLAEMYQPNDTEKFVETMKKGDITFLDKALINGKVIEFLKEKATIK